MIRKIAGSLAVVAVTVGLSLTAGGGTALAAPGDGYYYDGHWHATSWYHGYYYGYYNRDDHSTRDDHRQCYGRDAILPIANCSNVNVDVL
jgi:hypothetical protein